MFKKTISYTDFNEVPTTEDLYFNLSKSELFDNMHIRDDFESIQSIFSGPARDLEMAEIQKILDLMKLVVRLSYGIRSSDGKRFSKNEQVWNEFKDTAAYDALIVGLFENPETAFEFMVNVMPADLREKARAEVENMNPNVALPETTEGKVYEKRESGPMIDQPAYMRENRKPTSKEIREMSKEELVQAMAWEPKV